MTHGETPSSLTVRVVASREGSGWAFTIFNDHSSPYDHVLLESVTYLWGGGGNREETNRELHALPARSHACLHRDDDDAGEVNVDLAVRLSLEGRWYRFVFEFPKLANQRRLPLIQELGTRGFEVGEEGRLLDVD